MPSGGNASWCRRNKSSPPLGKIQSFIVPQATPELARLEIATRYQPMTSVAGDFFDFLQTSDHSLTILIANVSRHGVPAALVASMLNVCLAA